MIIKVLGPGCANCKNLERVTREAVADLGLALGHAASDGQPDPASDREPHATFDHHPSAHRRNGHLRSHLAR